MRALERCRRATSSSRRCCCVAFSSVNWWTLKRKAASRFSMLKRSDWTSRFARATFTSEYSSCFTAPPVPPSGGNEKPSDGVVAKSSIIPDAGMAIAGTLPSPPNAGFAAAESVVAAPAAVASAVETATGELALAIPPLNRGNGGLLDWRPLPFKSIKELSGSGATCRLDASDAASGQALSRPCCGEPVSPLLGSCVARLSM
mmetsp:Transcript_22621/g.63045  ORF Transcript_22621/g.63045 Transcript_22621/m.63045 type:complete len:202 (+) Transcript_22621:2469-3074(+)